ncbi:bifunctional 3,4-dihydroxy-2-butanone-4-phosphate synthase/GTP cyclohydrolase II [Komagataeibacter xylinus]|uniref:Multifunctional fusion protein n=2 Tax=Komagataeibacter xylinus TaxID=28448 RepID=A0A318PQV0_KOMXY|nr:3,4-dihydroxy-2-butanone-4-phosphate synthase [Komagataeibacter xylinus]PYD57549.1 bifunctional 3,4-dihydroxy-2-butanone-4-phosphate synthase/GTP cyclohydrolase II [Komagataeibacter xylinus]GBQ72608.1 3,4-dihydroxy-2-butanone 4-phosphate synthase [Komagataeibacter xylinus NBRC 15237]
MPPALAQAVATIRRGGMIILVDDEDRENEGDLVMAAELVTPDAMNFMVTHARGLVCMPMSPERITQLNLPMMTQVNTCPRGTAFTVSIEAREGVTTGISAADRAETVLVAAAPDAKPEDLVSPGHIFPLRAVPGGTVARPGHTEASVDLARMAGLIPAAVICEIMNEDGTMARMDDLRPYAKRHGLQILSIAELAKWLKDNPITAETEEKPAIEQVARARLPSRFGGSDMMIHAFRAPDGTEHVAMVKGEPGKPGSVPLVRLHSECVTGDALGSLRCDCGAQLQGALEQIGAAESGVLVYVRGHEGRGIGLANKIRAYALQDEGLDTVDANHRLGFETDARDWQAASAILRALGVNQLDLLTNNPDKVHALQRHGFDVRRRIALAIAPNPFNRAYLEAKRTRMGHALCEPATADAH